MIFRFNSMQIRGCQYLGIGLLALVFSVTTARAQTPPDAGVLLQQIERNIKPVKPTPVLRSKKEPMRALVGATVTVKAFKFSGNTLLSEDSLQKIVAPYLNHPLDFTQLQDAVAMVASAYRAAGWIVRVYLPQQEIEDGVVSVEIIEAVFGGSRFEGVPATRLSNEMIGRYVSAAQPAGTLLSAHALDRILLLLSDIPGANVTGNLHEGQAAGQTDLILNTADLPLFSGSASMDNAGSRATGDQHLSGNFNLNSPMGLGDQLSANLMASSGSSYGRVAMSLPVGYDGWRVGTSASYMTYSLVSADFLSLHARGSSTSYGLDASYPLIRSKLNNLNLALNYDHKFFNNEANFATTTRYALDTATVGLNSTTQDSWSGGGVNNLGLSWVTGRVNLNGSPNQLADASGIRTAGSFNKIRYSASRLQTLSDSVTSYLAISGQMAQRNIDSAEKFYLGGASGVRAYPSSEGGGADGQMINAELRSRLPYNFSLTGFYDWGHVTVNRNNNYAGAPALNNYSLQGFGVTAGWLSDFGLNLKTTWARRIGSNPNPTLTGADQDGTLYKNRFWLQASLPL
jgi:hemolysin activation/secretion protein